MRARWHLAPLLVASLAAGGSVLSAPALGRPVQDGAGQDGAGRNGPGRNGSGPGASTPSSILERVPDGLPRSADGRWATFFEDVAPEKIAEQIGEGSMGVLARGEALYEQSDFPGALEVLYPLLESQPDMPPALLILGTSYFRLRRYGDTITCLERFVDVAPTQVWRTQALGHSYYSLGRYDDALAHYEQVLAVLPDSPEAIRGLALSHMRLGDYPRALELLTKVVELDPDNWEAHTWQAQILFEEGELEAALASAQTARNLVPHEPRPWFMLKKLHWELGQDDEADRAERRWRELDALTQELRSARGKLLFNPDSFGLARQVAELTARVGDVLGTRKALDQVVRNTPEGVRRVDVYIYSLDLLWDLNDREGCERAAEALQIACAGEAAAWRRLERYYGETGRRREQIEAGERWRRLNGGED